MVQQAVCDYDVSHPPDVLIATGQRCPDENAKIADWLLHITQKQRNWGFGLCFLFLRNVKGFTWNHKRVYRIYR